MLPTVIPVSSSWGSRASTIGGADRRPGRLRGPLLPEIPGAVLDHDEDHVPRAEPVVILGGHVERPPRPDEPADTLQVLAEHRLVWSYLPERVRGHGDAVVRLAAQGEGGKPVGDVKVAGVEL